MAKKMLKREAVGVNLRRPRFAFAKRSQTMSFKQSIEFWVLDEGRAECLTLLEIGGKHRLLRARYHGGENGPYQLLGAADVSSCSVIEFLDLLSASLDRARLNRQRCEIHPPLPRLDLKDLAL